MTENHLQWTAKQGRILTADGDALQYYSQENGFPYSPEELPHHYLEMSVTHSIFGKWARARRKCLLDGAHPTTSLGLQHSGRAQILHASPIVGAWDRPLFVGKWEHSTNEDEIVYNVQTGTLFVDLRIPKTKPASVWERLGRNSLNPRKVLESMSDMDLRLFARQHIFGGYSMITTEDANRPLCTRHHCIDWNYVQGKPRPRPNKWYIESKNDGAGPCGTWKEWSYSTDENGQCYYFERWQRIKGDDNGEGFCLAMRKKKNDKQDDGILVVVGDHFNYILGRQWSGREKVYSNASNLVDLVDTAIGNGDRETAISHLSMGGGHGTISSGWKVDSAIQPWMAGVTVFEQLGGSKDATIQVVGDGADFFSWDVTFGSTSWEIYECSVNTAQELEHLLLLTEKKCKAQSRL